MKFSAISALAATGVLSQVAANPLRVVVVTTTQEISPNLRFGHSVPNNEAAVAMITRGTPSEAMEKHRKVRHACGGARLRQKAISLSNAFRHALGLPLIETETQHGEGGEGAHGGTIKITPFIGTPPTFIEPTLMEAKGSGTEGMTRGGDKVHTHRHHGHHRFGHFRKMKRGSFMRRLHYAIVALGPWEGRAVAFVLGCGIGVLLRMIWVLAVVAYRRIRGESGEDHYYSRVVEQLDDTDETHVLPPTYTYPDEKTDDGADHADTKSSTEEQK